jgi:hypothetical protein
MDTGGKLRYDSVRLTSVGEMQMKSTWRLVAECTAFTRVKPALAVGGLNPWDHNWVPLDQPEIVISAGNSASRDQWLRVYEIGDAKCLVRFAPCLSDNRIWSFYVPGSPDDPGSFEATTAQYEGHWRMSPEEASPFPWPITTDGWLGRAAFLTQLHVLEAAAERVVYRGTSICRLCGCENGHEAFRLGGWEWPSGYRHYIADHQVRPSGQFENFVAIFAGDVSTT